MSDKFKRERVAALPSLAVPATLAKPLWIRAPKKGPEYWTGFSRSKLYELEKDGKIRSVSIRGPGQQKGTRLFELKSILAFIEAQSRSRKKAALTSNENRGRDKHAGDLEGDDEIRARSAAFRSGVVRLKRAKSD